MPCVCVPTSFAFAAISYYISAYNNNNNMIACTLSVSRFSKTSTVTRLFFEPENKRAPASYARNALERANIVILCRSTLKNFSNTPTPVGSAY